MVSTSILTLRDLRIYMQTELSVRIRPQLDAFRESMNAAWRAMSLETSNGVVEGQERGAHHHTDRTQPR